MKVILKILLLAVFLILIGPILDAIIINKFSFFLSSTFLRLFYMIYGAIIASILVELNNTNGQ